MVDDADVTTSEAPTTAEGTPDTGNGEAPAEAGATEPAAAGSDERLRELEHDGEIAADYLEGLLDILDLDGDLDLDVEGDRAIVAIVGSGLGSLVGPRGATLEALQELTRLAVLTQTGARSRLMLDIGGHRDRRRAELTAIAVDAGRRVTESGAPESLAPMTPFERKVVHDALADVEGVHTESEGEEPDRRVVVLPDASP